MSMRLDIEKHEKATKSDKGFYFFTDSKDVLMPTYDYQCKKCGHAAEVLQKITEAPLTICPACKAPTFERGFGGGTGFQFKGSSSGNLPKAGGGPCSGGCSCHPSPS